MHSPPINRYNPSQFGMNSAEYSLELMQKYTEGMDFLNRWIYRLSEQYVGESILEVGPGGGAWLQQLVRNRKFANYTGVEVNSVFVDHLRRQYTGFPNVKFIQKDFLAKDFLHSQHGFDTVVAISCLEHLADDKIAVRRMKELILSGGRIILYLPALPILYNFGDHLAGHFRRYTKNRMTVIASQLNLKVARMRYCNLPGILSWIFNGFKKDTDFALNVVPSYKIQLFIRHYLKIERNLVLPFGLNLLCILERQ